MKRGPQPGTSPRGDQRSMVEKTMEAWDGNPPEWVQELAATVDRLGLKITAGKIGYSISTISYVCRRQYSGDIRRVEEKVRGALMGELVACPVIGDMRRDVCLDWQKKPFGTSSSLHTRLFRACRAGCPHSRLNGGDDAE